MCEQCDDPSDITTLDRRALLRGALVTGGAAFMSTPLLDLATGPALAAADETAMFERAAMGEDPVHFAASSFQAAASGPVIAIHSPPIVSRAKWGADESLRSGSPSYATIRKCIVHHTVTPNGSNGAAMCRSILRFHTQGNGWSDIGYNFLIDHLGTVYEGRWSRTRRPGEAITGENTSRKGVIGAHAKNYNTGSVGIALLGTFTSVTPTPHQLLALRRMLAWKAGRHGINPSGSDSFTNATGATVRFPNVSGHRDVGQTSCPGSSMYGILGAIRTQVDWRVRRGLVGYRILATDGSVNSYGGAFDFALGRRHGFPTAIAPGPNPDGYWVLDLAGNVHAHGTAGWHGDLPHSRVRNLAVDIAKTRTGGGYWVLGRDGGIFTYGDAKFHGSVPGLGIRARTTRLRANPAGSGYWILGDDGGIFCFGGTRFFGSLPGIGVRTRAVDFAPTPTGRGYWILGADGGVFCFGDAKFHGSVPGLRIRWDRPARAFMPGPGGAGYHVLADDGGVFSFGNVPFYGSLVGTGKRPVAIAPAFQR